MDTTARLHASNALAQRLAMRAAAFRTGLTLARLPATRAPNAPPSPPADARVDASSAALWDGIIALHTEFVQRRDSLDQHGNGSYGNGITPEDPHPHRRLLEAKVRQFQAELDGITAAAPESECGVGVKSPRHPGNHGLGKRSPLRPRACVRACVRVRSAGECVCMPMCHSHLHACVRVWMCNFARVCMCVRACVSVGVTVIVSAPFTDARASLFKPRGRQMKPRGCLY